jgi:hypothetical protein
MRIRFPSPHRVAEKKADIYCNECHDHAAGDLQQDSVVYVIGWIF